MLLTFFSALTPFAVRGNGLDDAIVFWALSIATAMFVVLQYPFGWTADHSAAGHSCSCRRARSGCDGADLDLIQPEAGSGRCC